MSGSNKMKRKMMLKKLADGENPIDISLEKYEQLKHKLYGWWGIVTPKDISAENCPLCFLYQKYGKCSNCPLKKVGEGCMHHDSAWKKLNKLLSESTIFGYGYDKTEIHIAISTLMFALKKAKEYEQKEAQLDRMNKNLAEFLDYFDDWSESKCTIEEVKQYQSVTYTHNYCYYLDVERQLLYRIRIRN